MRHSYFSFNQLILLSLSIFLIQCQLSDPIAQQDSKVTPTQGPKIIFDPFVKPLASVPFPNDISLTYQAQSPSFMQLNLSTDTYTELLKKSRSDLNRVEGFAPFSPIIVPFSGRVDLKTITDRSILLVNVDERSDRYGETIPFDLGRGFFPVHQPNGRVYGSEDVPYADNHLYALDNVEDLDGDGVDELITFYDLKANLLTLRPLKPLAQGAKYAVLILNTVKGWQSPDKSSDLYGSVESPYAYKAHASQIADVDLALNLTQTTWQNLAFAWTISTADLTRDMHEMREGLYGRGPLADLQKDLPLQFSEIRDNGVPGDAKDDPLTSAQDHPFILQGPFFNKLASLIGNVNGSDGYEIKFDDVDYFVFGNFPSAQLRNIEDANGNLLDWGVLWGKLQGKPKITDVPFFISVPNETEKFKKPFPVLLYFHGTNTSRLESILLANEAARVGIAVVSFDQVGHGPIIADIDFLKELRPDLKVVLDILPSLLAGILFPERSDEFKNLKFEEGLAKLDEVGIFRELARIGRWEDVDGDLRHDPAEGFFHADALKQCSSFWQDTLDGMQMIRILRNFKQENVPPAISNPMEMASSNRDRLFQNLLAGDFDADGKLDIGGPDVQISVAGTSLGGFHSLLMASLDREVSVASPIVSGGGLSDIYLRSGLRFIVEPLLLEFFGQAVVGCPISKQNAQGEEEGTLYFSLNNDANQCKADEATLQKIAFGSMPIPKAGTPISLTNLKSGEVKKGEINEIGGFDIQIATDAGDPLKLTIEREGTPLSIRTNATLAGYGNRPQTGDFIKAVAAQQHIFQRCDPISYSNQLLKPTLPNKQPVKTLLLNAVGDETVPIATAISLANSIGLFGEDQDDWFSKFDAFRKYGVLNGDFYDVDDIFRDNQSWEPILTPANIPTLDGLSGLRMFDVQGKHEWIAGYKDAQGFDYGVYAQRLMMIYHRCKGRVIYDQDPWCLQDPDCPEMKAILESDLCK